MNIFKFVTLCKRDHRIGCWKWKWTFFRERVSVSIFKWKCHCPGLKWKFSSASVRVSSFKWMSSCPPPPLKFNRPYVRSSQLRTARKLYSLGVSLKMSLLSWMVCSEKYQLCQLQVGYNIYECYFYWPLYTYLYQLD